MQETDSTPTSEALWTVDETANYLHMSKAWVYRRVESGEIPAARLGRVYRFHPARVRQYADKLNESFSNKNVIRLPIKRRT
jgi:excisionase family DNA binding protein